MAVKLKPLADQVIVITGASSGIGLATARKAAKAGAAVVLAARNGEALRAICEDINAQGGRAHAVVADVGERDDVEKIARAAVARFERIDTWINDAGVGLYGELTETAPEDHERLFQTNYFGVVNGSLEAVKHFRHRGGGGAVINVGAAVSDFAAPLQGAYSASKHAVKGFTDALRMELARDKAPISISLVKPGSVSSPFADHARNLMDKAASAPRPRYSPDVVADAILHAATHPIRDLSVGSAGRPITIGAATIPGLTDKVLGRVGPRLSRRAGPKVERDNLYEPGVDGLIDSEHLSGRKFSLSAEAQKRPGLTLGLGALAVVGLAAFLGRETLARNARPVLARAARPILLGAAMRRPLAAARLAAKHPRQTARLAAALR
ncbi:SDR family oxidoreductase [Phenylobacterium sp.]|uniref:SDR family oxidoreductase n=1 Tax=Phenylobacterium sp. TaxID=1871053 RepID=UPI00289FEB9E|nr:SDR family oxidoreductase [Phenylobacterium sp.]